MRERAARRRTGAVGDSTHCRCPPKSIASASSAVGCPRRPIALRRRSCSRGYRSSRLARSGSPTCRDLRAARRQERIRSASSFSISVLAETQEAAMESWSREPPGLREVLSQADSFGDGTTSPPSFVRSSRAESLRRRESTAGSRYHGSEQVLRAFKPFDRVFHIAALYRTETADRSEFTRVNVDATRNSRGCRQAVRCRKVYPLLDRWSPGPHRPSAGRRELPNSAGGSLPADETAR